MFLVVSATVLIAQANASNVAQQSTTASSPAYSSAWLPGELALAFVNPDRAARSMGIRAPCASASWFGTLVDTSDFPPRWQCGNWSSAHGWVHVVADLLIWGAYMSIPLALVYYIRKRPDVPFPRIFWLFAMFILSCGLGHLVEAGIFWWPAYRLSALVKVATALVSWLTVIALLPVIPRALALPGLEKTNEALREEIRHRRETEAILAASEARKNAIVQGSLDAIITIDLYGRIVEYNSAAEQLLGYPRDQALGREVAELVIPERFRAAHRKGLDHYRTTGEGPLLGKRLEMSALRADGTELPVELAITRVDGNDPALFTAFLRDISGRKKMTELFRLAVESSPAAMITADTSGRITLANRQAEDLFGYSRKELLDLSIESLIPEGIRAAHVNLREEYFRNPEMRAMGAGRDLYGQRKDGSKVPVEIGLNPIHTPEGLMVLASVIDITHRKRTEVKLQSILDELARSNADLEQFAYAASHDLRAPLRSVRNLAEWIQEDLGESLQGENVERMQTLFSRIDRLDRLIDDLLQYSRCGRLIGGLQRVDVGAMVEDIAELLSPRDGIRIVKGHGLPVFVTAATTLGQVLRNLIDNAVKHHDKPEGKVEVSGKDVGDFFEFTVSDDGPGIPAKYHDRVFRLFWTLRPRDIVEGSGMGLAIVQKTVERLGGKIQIQSEVERGAAFVFTWPKVIPTADASARNLEIPQASNRSSPPLTAPVG